MGKEKKNKSKKAAPSTGEESRDKLKKGGKPPAGKGKSEKESRRRLAAFRQDFEEMAADVARAIQEKAHVRAVFGEPFRLEERTVAPVGRVRVSLTGGAAVGREPEAGGGGGGRFGLEVDPVGYLHEKDGEVRFETIRTAPRQNSLPLNLAEYLPFFLKIVEKLAPVRVRRKKGPHRERETSPRGEAPERENEEEHEV